MEPSDPPLQQRSSALGPFTFTDVGQGPVVVAVHGMPGSVRDYRWLGAALEPSARFIRLDLPGFGQTPLASGPGPTVEARADFVLAALEALQLPAVTLLGHSMGGPVALLAAARAPAQVRGLGLLASVGLRPHRLLRRAFARGLLGRAVDWPALGPPLQRGLRLAFRATGFPSTTPLTEVTHTTRVLGAFSFAPILGALGHFQTPTLTAFALDDPYIEPAIFEELAARLPQGPRLQWAEGGHNIQKTHAAELGLALLAFASP